MTRKTKVGKHERIMKNVIRVFLCIRNLYLEGAKKETKLFFHAGGSASVKIDVDFVEYREEMTGPVNTHSHLWSLGLILQEEPMI